MYAADGISPIGGVPAVNQGTDLSMIPMATVPVGPEASRLPMVNRAYRSTGGYDPQFQIEIVRTPLERPNENAPGLSTMWAKLRRTMKYIRGIQPTRGGNIRTVEESMPVLSGMRNDHPDTERRGLMWENISPAGVGFSEAGYKDLVTADNVGPTDILNIPAEGMEDDVTKHIQDFPTNEFETMRAYRASFPTSQFKQAPAMGRSVVLQQIANDGSFVGELSIPDGAVTARIDWTSKGQNDLWWSLSSQAFKPVVGVQAGTGGGITQSGIGNDGALLNPNPALDYLVKGKRAMSFLCDNACIVSVSFYAQA